MVVWDWNTRTGQCELCGDSADALGLEMSVQSDDLFKLVHPEDLPKLQTAVAGALAGSGGYSLEYRVMLPTGRLAWISDRAQVWTDPADWTPHLVGASIEVTERRESEEALRH